MEDCLGESRKGPQGVSCCLSKDSPAPTLVPCPLSSQHGEDGGGMSWEGGLCQFTVFPTHNV